jgi:hypothetical protein
MFDPKPARDRLERLWRLHAQIGVERGRNRVFLDEIVSDRLQLLAGLQVLRDELQFATKPPKFDREMCPADLSLPSVLTTLAVTNCGDRIHQGEIASYVEVVASRFATLSEIGVLKPEAFNPTGGGTDSGPTLAHVTWAHALDDTMRKNLYEGNSASFVMCGFDLKTHVGRMDGDDRTIVFGRTQESPWRDPRAACGAIAGTLAHYDPRNDVHKRIRADLGEENFAFLSKEGVKSSEGVDITAAVAAAIVAIRGMLDTTHALTTEQDERGLSHLTASVTVNRPAMVDTIVYLGRATVFDGEIRTQCLGLDAKKYAGQLVAHKSGDRRLELRYAGHDPNGVPIETETYSTRQSVPPRDIFA